MLDSLTGGFDAVKDATGAFGKITESLGGVTDEASAEAAAPALEEASGTLSGLAGKVDSLPGPIKDKVAGKVGEFSAQFDALTEKVAAIPGVGGIIQPHIDSIKQTLTSIGG